MNHARERREHAREGRTRARKEAKVSPLLMTTFPQVASGISFGKLKQTATLCMALLYTAFNSTRMHNELHLLKAKERIEML